VSIKHILRMPWHGSKINNDSTQNESNKLVLFCNEAEELCSIGLVLVVFNEMEDEEKWWLHAESSSLLVQIYKVANKIEMIH